MLEQSVHYAYMHCVNNQTLELINFSHNLMFSPVIFDVFNEFS